MLSTTLSYIASLENDQWRAKPNNKTSKVFFIIIIFNCGLLLFTFSRVIIYKMKITSNGGGGFLSFLNLNFQLYLFFIRCLVLLILVSYILVPNFIFIIFSVLYTREERDDSPHSKRESSLLLTISITKHVKISV